MSGAPKIFFILAKGSKTFSDEGKIRKFVIRRFSLTEWPKEVLQIEKVYTKKL